MRSAGVTHQQLAVSYKPISVDPIYTVAPVMNICPRHLIPHWRTAVPTQRRPTQLPLLSATTE